MDEWLDEQGLYRKNNALDGTCLFRAVAEQLMPANPVTGHLELRRECVNFMRENKELFQPRVPSPDDFDEYLENLAAPKTWAGPLELDAISRMQKVDFEVFHGPDGPLPVTANGYEKVLLLCVTGNTYYDAVYKKTQIQTMGFCQSIVYHILYEKVFKLEDLDYAVDKMLHDKAARAQRERYLSNQSVTRDENDLYLENPEYPVNVKQVVDSGAILFPYKVAKALDPDIYRNTEFDNWVESQRGKPIQGTPCLCNSSVSRRNNFWYGNGGHLRVGVKCHVRVDDRILTAHIQEMSPDLGPAVVYVEEFSKKLKVSYDSLIPMPRSSLRPDWSYSHKHQMISRLGSKDRPDDCSDLCRRRMRNRRKDDTTPTSPKSDGGSFTTKDEPLKEEAVASEADSTVSSQGSTSSPSKRILIVSSADEQMLVNVTVTPSSKFDGSDLPHDDPSTLRFFYNMGLEYYKAGSIPPMKVMNLINPSDEYPPAQMITGAPIFQSSPHMMAVTETVLTPGAQACQGPPLISSLPPSPIMTAVPVPYVPPHQPEQVVPQSPLPSSTPPPPRESKERGRNSKFMKPPRFQRLESTDGRHNGHRIEDELQQPEVTSTTGVVPLPCQFSVPPPPLAIHYCQPVSYTYPPETEVTCDPMTYGEATYQEVPAYFPEHVQVAHLPDGSTTYVEAPPPDVNYQVHYPYYPVYFT